jgi:phenylalanine-4-hydroxylase
MATLERVPLHLRRFVVEQDYARYTAADQAVWRFVLLQLYSRLASSAHPAYASGLRRAGMSCDRIPRIAEMDARLAEVGWGAVCVDGFIPPRAFVEFQAQGILPIAAEIRSRQHLPYTPAPDIIHEAAGHAPILPDEGYARFLRNAGAVGQRAFSVPEDVEVYDGVRALSIVKEDLNATPAELNAAESRLTAALASVKVVSEAARLARLYWWTVEYGLIGSVDDYKLYGAGLLSSLGESHSCHERSVAKQVLTPACIDVPYDITRPQPQLFVVREFAELEDVLEEVARTFAFRRGGAEALAMAVQSRDVATVELDSGVQLIGVVEQFDSVAARVASVRWRGSVAVAHAGQLLPGGSHLAAAMLDLPLGASALSLNAAAARSAGDRVHVTYSSGLVIEGYLLNPVRSLSGETLGVRLADVTVHRGGGTIARVSESLLLRGERVVSAWAGAADPAFWPASAFSNVRVPRPTQVQTPEGRLLELFATVAELHRENSELSLLRRVGEIYAELSGAHPDEWLLRWNLLELVSRRDGGAELSERLRRDLLRLETRFHHEQPIASGLRYLGLEAA